MSRQTFLPPGVAGLLRSGLPIGTGNKAFDFAIRRLYPQKRDESSLRRPVALLLNNRLSRHGIGACMQQLAHLQDSEITPWILSSAELAHGRLDHNLLAVDPGCHVVLGGDEERGLFGSLRQLEVEAEIVFAGSGPGQRVVIRRPDPLRRRLIISALERHVPGDPFRLPVLGGKQSHLPPAGRAVGRSVPLGIPYPHLPVVAPARFNRGSRVGNIDRLVGFNPAAVPNIGSILCQVLRRAGHANLIRRLPGAPSGILKLPGKPGMRDVDSQRLLHAFALQVVGRMAVESRSRGGKQPVHKKQENKG